MATFANATNPFIKSNGASKRAVPGTARLHNQITDEAVALNDENSMEEINLLMDNNNNNKSPTNAKTSYIAEMAGCLREEELVTSNEVDPLKQCCEEVASRLDLKDHSPVLDVEINLADKTGEVASIHTNLTNEITKAEIIVTTNVQVEQESKVEVEKREEEKEKVGRKVDNEEETELEVNEIAHQEQDHRQHQHLELIRKLRLQLTDLERYAYERGELEKVPPSVLAERQAVILETLKERLSLKICANEIEKLELDEIRKQVDKEIHDLIDPLITKEHLLNQLQTQLIDLERYIAHLHGTLGRMHEKSSCSCHLHGCLSPQQSFDEELSRCKQQALNENSSGVMNNNSLPKTTRLIRNLVTQLICSDLKVSEAAKREQQQEAESVLSANSNSNNFKVANSSQNIQDGPAWSLHIDRVILATDSLINLFTLESNVQKAPDEALVESIVRRQLVPAIKTLLDYGLFDPDAIPRSSTFASMLFDPYLLLSTLTCFPSSQPKYNNAAPERGSVENKIHVWNIIEEYYQTRNEQGFKTSSVKTLSHSFNLPPSVSGPIKITSKQALLIAVEDIVETLAKCKPNGPESHFRVFIYTALNRSKLTTWLRLIFKNKSVARKYYHNFSFVVQPDKMDKFLATLEPLNQFEFKLRTDVESIEQFVSAF